MNPCVHTCWWDNCWHRTLDINGQVWTQDPWHCENEFFLEKNISFIVICYLNSQFVSHVLVDVFTSKWNHTQVLLLSLICYTYSPFESLNAPYYLIKINLIIFSVFIFTVMIACRFSDHHYKLIGVCIL